MIPKYPDSGQTEQWSDHNYDNGSHGTCKEQDLSFRLASSQGCSDHVMLLPRTQVDTTQVTHA